MAYAGIGADIGIYFIDRLHRPNRDWVHAVTVGGFTLQQAKESSKYCSGETEIYVLQRPPNPRWRAIGTDGASTHFFNSFQAGSVSQRLDTFLREHRFNPEYMDGYKDERYPEPTEMYDSPFEPKEFRGVIPLRFFPSNWLELPAYQKRIDETENYNRDTLLRLRLLNDSPSPPQKENKEQK